MRNKPSERAHGASRHRQLNTVTNNSSTTIQLAVAVTFRHGHPDDGGRVAAREADRLDRDVVKVVVGHERRDAVVRACTPHNRQTTRYKLLRQTYE